MSSEIMHGDKDSTNGGSLPKNDNPPNPQNNRNLITIEPIVASDTEQDHTQKDPQN